MRWGIVAWELWSRESFKVPWREVVWALRRLEARGVVLGGRFVAGLSGEQYALPEAFDELRATHRRGANGEQVVGGRGGPAQHDGHDSRRGPRADAPKPARACTATASSWTSSRRGDAVNPKRTIDLNADVGEATDAAGIEVERTLLVW